MKFNNTIFLFPFLHTKLKRRFLNEILQILFSLKIITWHFYVSIYRWLSVYVRIMLYLEGNPISFLYREDLIGSAIHL